MQTASKLPMTVGVAPGTTTVVLSGPQGCENPARVARQRLAMFPPGKKAAYLESLRPQPAMPTTAGMTASIVPRAPQATVSPGKPPRVGYSTGAHAVTAAVSAVDRVQQALDPYGTMESLKGFFRRKPALGYTPAPYGDRTPYPSSEIVSVGKGNVYCERRSERERRGPNFRNADQTYRQTFEPGLGAIPTDLQLSTQYGRTPVTSQWVPFKQGAYSPLPWIPPTGAIDNQPQNQGYLTQLAGPRMVPVLGETTAATPGPSAPPPTTTPAQAAAPFDAGHAAVDELKRHQDRMYSLGIVSAMAAASTALINVFRFLGERQTARRKKTPVAAEPAPSLSGRQARRRSLAR